MAIPIVISNCAAATSATFICNSLYAVNGIDCFIKNISENCTINTIRPYGFISSNCNCSLAIQGTCSNKVYILDRCLNEIGSICLPNIGGPLLSAYILCNRKMLLTYRKKIVIANSDGSTGEIIATADCAETDFISAFPALNGTLLAFNNGIQDTIQYRSCNGNIGTCALPPCINIKNFVVGEDCTVYGLISKGYPYRYLFPILVDGTLNCVNETCFGTSLCN